jgi:hypothetical protein
VAALAARARTGAGEARSGVGNFEVCFHDFSFAVAISP